jgi:hypothetical protein
LDIIAIPVLDILQHEHWFTIEQNRNQHKQQRYCSNVNDVGGGRDRDDGGERCSTKDTTTLTSLWIPLSVTILLWLIRPRSSQTNTRTVFINWYCRH